MQPQARPALPEGVPAPSSTVSLRIQWRQLHGTEHREVPPFSLLLFVPSFPFSLPFSLPPSLPLTFPQRSPQAQPPPRGRAPRAPLARAHQSQTLEAPRAGCTRSPPLPYPPPLQGRGREPAAANHRQAGVKREARAGPRAETRYKNGGRARARGSLAAGADGGGTHTSCRPRPLPQRPPRPPRAAP